MSKTLLIIVSLILSASGFANCNLSTDIKRTDLGMLYSFDCHREVGKTFIENEDRKRQVEIYKDLLDVSKMQHDIQKERGDLWYSTSKDLEQRLHKIDRYNDTKNYLYFAGGIILTIAAGFAVGQASK